MTDPAPIIRLVPQHSGEFDCVVSALASLLGLSYEEVVRVGALVDRRYLGRWGFTIGETERLAKRLGHPLKRRRAYDLDEDTGLLSLTMKPRGHLALLVRGQIYSTESDGSSAVWDPLTYLRHHRATPGVLLVPATEATA